MKLSPDLTEEATAEAVEVVDDLGLDGIIATNTSTDRPDGLHGEAVDEAARLVGCLPA